LRVLDSDPHADAIAWQHAHDRGIRAGSTAGDEVYGGLGLREGIRERGVGTRRHGNDLHLPYKQNLGYFTARG